MQTHTVRVVRIQPLALDSVPAELNIGLLKLDLLVAEDFVAGDLLVVNLKIAQGHCLEIQEKFTIFRFFLQVKVDDSFAEVVRAFVQGELEIVFDFADEFAAALSLTLLEGHTLVVSGIKGGLQAQVFGDEGL